MTINCRAQNYMTNVELLWKFGKHSYLDFLSKWFGVVVGGGYNSPHGVYTPWVTYYIFRQYAPYVPFHVWVYHGYRKSSKVEAVRRALPSHDDHTYSGLRFTRSLLNDALEARNLLVCGVIRPDHCLRILLPVNERSQNTRCNNTLASLLDTFRVTSPISKHSDMCKWLFHKLSVYKTFKLDTMPTLSDVTCSHLCPCSMLSTTKALNNIIGDWCYQNKIACQK